MSLIEKMRPHQIEYNMTTQKLEQLLKDILSKTPTSPSTGRPVLTGTGLYEQLSKKQEQEKSDSDPTPEEIKKQKLEDIRKWLNED